MQIFVYFNAESFDAECKSSVDDFPISIKSTIFYWF